jgi:hypothetical protein
MKKTPTLPLTYNSRVQAESPGSGAVPKVKKRKRNVNNVPIIKKTKNLLPLTIPEFQEPLLKKKDEKER